MVPITERYTQGTRAFEIAKRALLLTQTYLREFGINRIDKVCLDIDDLYQSALYPEYEFELIRDQDLGFIDGDRILGQTFPSRRQVFIDKSLATAGKDRRSAFTHGHEFGHAVLHRGMDGLCRSTLSDQSSLAVSRLEREANLFAKNLLMPGKLVSQVFSWAFDTPRPMEYRGPAVYTMYSHGVDRQVRIGSFADYCETYASEIRHRFFSVSRLSLALRLHELGLVRSPTKEVFQIGRKPDRQEWKQVGNLLNWFEDEPDAAELYPRGRWYG